MLGQVTHVHVSRRRSYRGSHEDSGDRLFGLRVEPLVDFGVAVRETQPARSVVIAGRDVDHVNPRVRQPVVHCDCEVAVVDAVRVLNTTSLPCISSTLFQPHTARAFCNLPARLDFAHRSNFQVKGPDFVQ